MIKTEYETSREKLKSTLDSRVGFPSKGEKTKSMARIEPIKLSMVRDVVIVVDMMRR